ncbi:hypothetical protein NB689_002401 [Xanthomonas sacchari]|nr:hypothetical protein [Xanthomonas sacchari]
MPGSCSTGLSSLPSRGIGDSRTNGLEVNRTKARKPLEISPSTPSTRAANASGKCLPLRASATVHRLRMAIHSSSEPSCAPHTAASR